MTRLTLAATIVLASLFLTGCETTQTPEPATVVQRVEVPVPVACKPDLGPEPTYPDTAAALAAVPYPSKPTLPQQVLNVAAQVKLLLKGRIYRIQRMAELKAGLDGCAHIDGK